MLRNVLMPRWCQGNALELVEVKVDGSRWGCYLWKWEQKREQKQGRFGFFHHGRSFNGRNNEVENTWDHEGSKCHLYGYLWLLVCIGPLNEYNKKSYISKMIESIANYSKGFKPPPTMKFRSLSWKEKYI